MVMNIVKKNNKGKIQSVTVNTGDAMMEFMCSRGKINGIFTSLQNEDIQGDASVLFKDGFSLVSVRGDAEFGGCLSGKGKLENQQGKEFVSSSALKNKESHVFIGGDTIMKIRFNPQGGLNHIEISGQDGKGKGYRMVTIMPDCKVEVESRYKEQVRIKDFNTDSSERFGTEVIGEQTPRKTTNKKKTSIKTTLSKMQKPSIKTPAKQNNGR